MGCPSMSDPGDPVVVALRRFLYGIAIGNIFRYHSLHRTAEEPAPERSPRQSALAGRYKNREKGGDGNLSMAMREENNELLKPSGSVGGEWRVEREEWWWGKGGGV
ncbi:hypothetical protein OIU78_008997 [Salix suchowensis]|nr:hypothetical protein OIU78_008997 [Salix suchowensis]